MSLRRLFEVPEWSDRALCNPTDAELWYATDEQEQPLPEVVATCAECPVKAECLEYALRHDERFGVWGGLTPSQRATVRRRRSRERRAELLEQLAGEVDEESL